MINEKQIALRGGGNFTNLDDYLDGRIVVAIPFVDTQDLSFSVAQHSLIAAAVMSGKICKGSTGVSSGGYIAAALAGAVGTAATTNITDSLGNVLNAVEVRDASTHEVLKEGNRDIFGLIQCSSTVTDGDAIAAAASENLQISLVYYSESGVITLATALTAAIEFQANKMITRRNLPTIFKEGGAGGVAITDSELKLSRREFVVGTAFIANEVITIATGAGASSGASTPTGDTLTLNASEALMNADRTCKVERNGVNQFKGSGKDVVWDSTTTFHFVEPLYIGDTFAIERILK
jgi:hypothetical protein